VCGTDIGRDYKVYEINRDHPPFFDRDLEYPPLIGELMYAATVPFDHGYRWPFLVNAVVLAALAAVTTWMLWQRYGLRTRRWALSPPLIVQGLTNWDLLAVAPATIGLLQWEAGRVLSGGALLGAGTAAKLFPALYVPILAVAAWRHAARMITGFVIGCAVFAVPVYAAAPDALRYLLEFHSDRTPTRGSVLFFVFRDPLMQPWLAHDTEARAATIVALVALAAAMGVIVVRVARQQMTPVAACALATMAFMVTSKVYSPQYDIWLVPFLVMVPVRTSRVVHFYVASSLVWLLTAATPALLPSPDRLYLVGAAVGYRLVVLVLVAGEIWELGRARRPDRSARPVQSVHRSQ
jgi:hypothetical protein